MDVHDYYGQLRKHYIAVPKRQRFAVSMEELSELLSCTRRNTQMLLHKMTELGLVEWIPGRGRGNLSQLAFLKSYRELAFAKAQELVEKEKINEAWKLMEQFEDQAVKAEFMAWLTRQFGLRQDTEEKDVLRFPFYRPVLRLDPAYVSRRTESHWVEQIFNTLVKFTQGAFQPQLAHYWESNEEHTQWSFFLRKGVRFHHGKRMTARDVAFTFKRLMASSPANWQTSMIESVTITGTYSLTITLKEPNALFIHSLCTERFSIVPEHAVELGGADDFSRMPIGTGPFRLTRNDESMLIAEANELYFEGCPHLNRIEMWVWPNYESSGEWSVPAQDSQLAYFEAQLKQQADGKREQLEQLEQLEQGSTYLAFNLAKKGTLQSLKLRQAIHYGLNRQQMIADLGGIREQASTGFLEDEMDTDYGSSYDFSYAVQLVSESGYAGEMLKLYTYEMPSNEQSAEWTRQACEKLGIRIEIGVFPIEELVACAEHRKEADIILGGEVLGEQPDMTLIELYKSDTSFVASGLRPEDRAFVDEHISLCLREQQQEARLDILMRIQERLKQQFSLLFLHHSRQLVGHHQSLQGIALNAWGNINYKDVWVRRTT
ncbi:DNA-binding transcriptional regulator SgrR of sgrS sRNA, contains a MarR-type HTH domain and a solute-binding domain [Paenibacillus algorifonticola]|uniref:DNA-binding transcriptional regulator SgrR of sgrS sRNA, contains a MarR-type HTH domain and a solute-binding domain n=1 Tax=Paenibacillus algorifonticola TaxID=684063 RepID=A0A1I2FJQ4_9BACL|nr:ABC transporter substrate-binding protein [Paenibacillus algorifonticola]SFF05515.1 DNA-binding transcriptional regulator SgrR of sgrS sRNA, contains a MarR-type HTH domain and a solute-binding domain [Paenibacillus algorifonticola]